MLLKLTIDMIEPIDFLEQDSDLKLSLACIHKHCLVGFIGDASLLRNGLDMLL